MFSDAAEPPSPDAASPDPDAGAVAPRPPAVGTITVAAQRYLGVLDNQTWFVVHDQDGRVWSIDTLPAFADSPLELEVPARAMVTFLSRNDWGVPSVTTVTEVEPGDELVLWGLVHPGFTLGTVTIRFPRLDASTRKYTVAAQRRLQPVGISPGRRAAARSHRDEHRHRCAVRLDRKSERQVPHPGARVRRCRRRGGVSARRAAISRAGARDAAAVEAHHRGDMGGARETGPVPVSPT